MDHTHQLFRKRRTLDVFITLYRMSVAMSMIFFFVIALLKIFSITSVMHNIICIHSIVSSIVIKYYVIRRFEKDIKLLEEQQ